MTETIKARGLVFGDKLEAQLAFEKKPAEIVRVATGEFVSQSKAGKLAELVECRLGQEAKRAIEAGVFSLPDALVKALEEHWSEFSVETQGINFDPATPSRSVEALVEAAKTDPALRKIIEALIALGNGWERGMKDKATKAKLKTDDDYSAVKVLVPVMRVLRGDMYIDGLWWYLMRTASFYYLKEWGGVKPKEGTKWSPKPLSLSQIEEILTILGKE